MKRSSPMRWRKARQEGFKPVYQFELWHSGKKLAVVAPLTTGYWFSYGLHGKWNTSMSPVRDAEEAKADALRRAKAALAGESGH